MMMKYTCILYEKEEARIRNLEKRERSINFVQEVHTNNLLREPQKNFSQGVAYISLRYATKS